MTKALFLDRDGVLNVDKGYVYKWDDIIWIEEIFDIIKLANEKNYKVIVLTNQSGIFQKKYTHEDVVHLHEKMGNYLKNKNLIVDDWFFCAEMDNDCRKPRPGMLLAAQKKYDIDLSNSFMIGDKATDVFEQDGQFTRPFTLLVQGNYDLKDSAQKERVKVFSSHRAIGDFLKLALD